MIVFLEGDTVDLCVPDEGDIPEWTGWINNPSITKFLETGMFPQTEKLQSEYIFEAIQKKSRVILSIKSKAGNLLGTVSLSDINFEKRECQIAIIMPKKEAKARYGALEAMALMTTHAIERLGMRRVFAGQAYPDLKNWNEALELIGFFPEGLVIDGFTHGEYVSHAIKIAVYKEDFIKIRELRGGKIWPGERCVTELLHTLHSRQRSHEKVFEAISRIRNEALDTLLNCYDRAAKKS